MSIKIMLDAGHYGYRNQSPVVKEYYESRRMWMLCEYLYEELLSYGIEAFKTRTDIERDLALEKRGKMAKGCDMFISLHSNAVSSSGSEETDRVSVYAPYDNRNNSHKLASQLAETVRECMGVSKAYVKTRKSEKGNYEYYGVLRGAARAGCPLYYIVEHSFHTNAYAAKWLLNDENLRLLAKREAETITDYFGIVKEIKKGDIDMNGKIDANDIISLKRYNMGTLDFTPEQEILADIDENGKVDICDYITLKREYMK